MYVNTLSAGMNAATTVSTFKFALLSRKALHNGRITAVQKNKAFTSQ